MSKFKFSTAFFLFSASSALFLTACNNGTSEPQANAPDHLMVDNKTTGLSGEGISVTPDQIAALGNPISIEPKTAALQKVAATDFTISFDDRNAIKRVPNHSSNTFTYAPFYVSNVSSFSQVEVVPADLSKFDHYHLDFYDYTKNCYSTAPNVGVLINGVCQNSGVDAANTPRSLAPHSPNEFIKINYMDWVRKLRPFDLKSFYLRPTTDNSAYGHVRIYVHRIGIGWWYWADLASAIGTGYTWYFGSTAANIDEMQIVSPVGSLYNWEIDNIVITPH